MWEDKETTAPDPSVAPDGEQPSALARTDSIATFEETNKQFGKMRIFSMPELMDTHFPSRPCIIENLLPAGTYLLAGAPKIGKSFLVLQMAYQVSTGEPFLGFSPRQGTVLYLALEDTCERLQKRLAQMTERDSPDLVLSVLADTLEEDLLEHLENFLFESPETVLVIIDTLQRIRGQTPDNGSYAADYDTIAKLKAFSDQRGIALLLVHHTRKEGAEDVFGTISGTNGILGAADGAFVLHKDKRTSGDAILDVVGRDQPQIRLHLRFDPTHSLWQATEVETEPFKEPPNPLLEFLSRLVNEENPLWSGTATERFMFTGTQCDLWSRPVGTGHEKSKSREIPSTYFYTLIPSLHEHEASGGGHGRCLYCRLTSFSRSLQTILRINLDGTKFAKSP